MLLCDIGNTSYHFLNENSNYKENVETFNPQTIKGIVYFISVNAEVKKKLDSLENWIDLAAFLDKSSYYKTMGIDRIFAVEALQNAVVVDAGSAITVDVVKDGVFMGGFIYPGLKAMSEAYSNISPALDYEFNFELDNKELPKNSQDAISYGFLMTFHREVLSYKMPIVLTGGDASKFKKIFHNAKIDDELIFSGMKKILKNIK